MTELTVLLLPVLLSSVLVFIASSLFHMVFPWHKNDYPRLPEEDKVMNALRPFGIPPGEYMMPRPSGPQDMKSPEFLEKMKQGPVMIITTWKGASMNMGKNLVQWFLYTVLVGCFSAYIAGRALGPGASYLQVFRFVGATAFLSYGMALVQLAIWYHRSWKVTLKEMTDGLVYALLTAGVFGWLWPKI